LFLDGTIDDTKEFRHCRLGRSTPREWRQARSRLQPHSH
jgi:hypothetical protein